MRGEVCNLTQKKKKILTGPKAMAHAAILMIPPFRAFELFE
jgi:hypothetical protein